MTTQSFNKKKFYWIDGIAAGVLGLVLVALAYLLFCPQANATTRTAIMKQEEAQTERSVQLRAADPGSPATNQLWINTTSDLLKYYNGSTTKTVSGSGSNPTFTTKTTTYTILGTDGTVIGDATGGSFTLTLPSASTNAGKILDIQKSDSTSGIVTITRTGSDTVSGATSTTVNTQGESIRLQSDGTSNWVILERKIPSIWVQTTSTITASGSNPTKGGGTTLDKFYWRRVRDSIEIRVEYRQTSAGSAGSGNYRFLIPNSWSADTAKVTSAPAQFTSSLGTGVIYNGSEFFTCHAELDTTNTNFIISLNGESSYWGSGRFSLGSSVIHFSISSVIIPISGWNG